MQLTNNQRAFLELVRAGLWETEARLLPFEKIDFGIIYEQAVDQTVIGLITAGFDHVRDVKIPQEETLRFVGSVLQIESQNNSMNFFVGNLIEKLRSAGIYALLVKGQGIAQCYNRPLWRMSGDVDLFLSKDAYERAKSFLKRATAESEPEDSYLEHIAFTLDTWIVELHGNLRTGLSSRVDKILALIQQDVFQAGRVRVIQINGKDVFLPSPTNDVLFVFTHFLKHFFKGGIGLRQICDWCRLLWHYRAELDLQLLESRVCQMGLKSEWEAFGAFAVDYLGMPVEAMPFYPNDVRWRRKAEMICEYVLKSGAFGHRDLSYIHKYPNIIRKAISLCRGTWEYWRLAVIFPKDTISFYLYFIKTRMNALVKGE